MRLHARSLAGACPADASGALGAPEAMLWHTLWVALQHCLSDGLRALRQQLIRDQGYKLNVTPVLSHVYQKSVKLYPERDVR